MSNHEEIIAETRREIPSNVSQIGSSARSVGPPALRNVTKFPDSVLENEIQTGKSSIEAEFPDRSISFDQNAEAKEALKYFTFIRASFLNQTDSGPRSVSHARRYEYDDEQLEYWRDRLIRALKGV